MIASAPSFKSKVLEHAGDALARINGKALDTHLGPDKFNFKRLDANGVLTLSVRLGFRRVPLLH